MTEQEQQEYLQNLGEYIVKLREQKGMKQYELADAMDVDVRIIRRIEKGETNIQVLSLIQLAFVLDVSPISFLELSDY